jgi:uncharacterized protein YhaN
MRFRRVVFRCFGPFQAQALDLSSADGLQVVYGPNEAGKSAALRGLRAFLFGFPVQSGNNFLFRYNQFRVHAIVENAAGLTRECIRRKGNKDTLRTSDDKEPIPGGQLAEFLGGIDEPQFEQLFGLDAAGLVAGGRAMADGQGELGEALFAAGAGMKGLRALSRQLEERQQALYKAGGKNQPIPEALRKHRQLDEEVRRHALPAETYAAAAAAARAARERVGELNAERKKMRIRLDERKLYQAALPTIDLLHAARQRLQPVADAPLLSGDFDAKLEAVRTTLNSAGSQLAEQERQHQDLVREVEESQPAAAILVEEDEIDDLLKLVGADKTMAEEAVKAATFSLDEKGKARDIYRELTGTTDWEQMDRLKPRLDERRRITELANEHAAVVENVETKNTALRDVAAVLGDARKELAGAPPTVDWAGWQTAVDEIAELGPLETSLRKRVTAAQAEEEGLGAEFASFTPPAPGSWHEAPALPVPLAETVERFRNEFEDARRAAADLSTALQLNQRDIGEVEGLLIEKAGAEPIPTVQALTASRCDRDGGMHCIRRRLDGRPDEPGEQDFIRRHAPDRSLIDAAESAVRQCDTLADRLRHEADRVAASVTLPEKLRRLHEHRLELEGHARAAAKEQGALGERWQTEWRASGVAPADPEVMQAWVGKWSRFRERVTAWRVEGQACRADQARIDSWRERLADACPATRAANTLSDALALARAAIEQARSARAVSDKSNEEVSRLERELTKAEKAAEQAEKRGEEWARQWSEAVAVLRLKDAVPSITTAQEYLARIDRMQLHLKDMRIKDARVREIENDRNRLIDRVNHLRQRLDPASRATTAETLDTDFRSVEAALRDARAQRARHARACANLHKAKEESGKTTRRLREAEAALAALAAEAGVDVDGIPGAVQRARERAKVAPDVRQYEDALTKNAGGISVEDFIAAALQHRDGLDQEIEDLTRRVEQLDAEIDLAVTASNEADRILTGYDQASDAAAGARQQAALVSRRLEDHVVEYAALHLARTALERAKERYRARHQDTLLDKAGHYFQVLTDGAFRGIEIDNDDGVDVLKAVRAESSRPDARVSVGGLSDGTRDQLFLALRLAGIERHLQVREPVPLIIDDVLVNFDDDRTRSTLRCLAELAKKTQVLLFTHHRHVVNSARAVCPSATVHELGSCAGDSPRLAPCAPRETSLLP